MNEERFSGKSEQYAKFRPSYPEEFLVYLYTEVGFSSNSTVADVGSGTGIFTGQMLNKGTKVYGVEPNDDMRKTAERALLRFLQFTSIKGSAECTDLPEKSVDFVTVAQAFHWFDAVQFQKECKRILKPGGKVVLVWNHRDNCHDVTKENKKINQKFCAGFQGFSGGFCEHANTEAIHSFFRGNYETKLFKNPLFYEKESFIGRNLSSSYAPKAGEKHYEPYIKALEVLFDAYSQNGILAYPFFTQCYVGEV